MRSIDAKFMRILHPVPSSKLWGLQSFTPRHLQRVLRFTGHSSALATYPVSAHPLSNLGHINVAGIIIEFETDHIAINRSHLAGIQTSISQNAARVVIAPCTDTKDSPYTSPTLGFERGGFSQNKLNGTRRRVSNNLLLWYLLDDDNRPSLPINNSVLCFALGLLGGGGKDKTNGTKKNASAAQATDSVKRSE